ncbi:radical SAM protein [Patescibacteria group bacterium]|nr:radical SAM protein [Patescibacteria group bacterium]
MKKALANRNMASSCYFRSSVTPPERKALLQITERCNLNCAHCFLSAGPKGNYVSIDNIRKMVIPRLRECRVVSITLTGGEPFLHPDILDIVLLFKASNIQVGICSNASVIKPEQIESLTNIGDVHVNVSLDGFKPESHGKFRGNEESFLKTISGIRLLGDNRLLRGILVTPNTLADINEYAEICEFAIQNHASYVLMNPLSRMGRGVASIGELGSPDEMMRKIKEAIQPFRDRIEVVDVRFPNEQKLPLSSCEAGNIIYVFTHGEVTICPYLIFAARTPQSKHKSSEFIIGNIFKDADISKKLDKYNFQELCQSGNNPECQKCHLRSVCGKGCPAAIIASGNKLGGMDKEVCPIVDLLSEDKNG